MQQGCYTCLKEALAIFDKHAAGEGADPPASREGQFDAALLIAIREKELGIPGDESMAQGPTTLVLPSRQAGARRRRARSSATPPALDPDQRALVTGRNRPPLEPDNPKRRALDAAPETDLTAKYVALSIDCEQQKLIESVDMQALTAALRGRAADAVPPVDLRPPGGAERRRACAKAIRAGPTRFYWEARRELVVVARPGHRLLEGHRRSTRRAARRSRRR